MDKNKERKRIGILTMYYNSANYGGLLQAYALVRYLNDRGYDSKQICYDFSKITININNSSNNQKNQVILQLKRIVKKALNECDNAMHGLSDLKKLRKNACKDFRDSIPHTKEVYSVDTLKKANQDFDVFITGSDQVWNPNGYRPGFFLTFVDGTQKTKIAYAASVSNRISSKALDVYKTALQDFDVISVREKADVMQIRKATEKEVQWAVDPVFLLSKEEWSSVVSEIDDIISEPYIFCYFLGDSSKQRKLALEYASSKKLKIVTIPYMQMNYRKCDSKFGDVKLWEVTPNQFLGLIRNAQRVFTDSFHATAFSLIFQKKFVVFERSGHPEMIERIKSIVRLFKCDENLINEEIMTTEKLDELFTKTHSRYELEEFNDLLANSKSIIEL